jgi:cyclopropane fatty-acyl-phospholipid synthase-like methyltransferase
MTANLTWDHVNDWALLKAHGGWEYGNTLEEALPKLRAKKKIEANFTSTALELNPDDVFAEIGPGFGFEAAEIASQVSYIHLFDISRSFQDFCRKNVSAPNVSFHLIEPGSLEALEGKQINKIYAGGVFIHFNTYDLFLYLTQISKALPLNGKLLFNYRNLAAPGALTHQDWDTSLGIYRNDKLSVFGLMYWNSPQTIEITCKAANLAIDRVIHPQHHYPMVLCSKLAGE